MAMAAVPGGHMLRKLVPGVALLLVACFVVFGAWPSIGTTWQGLHEHDASQQRQQESRHDPGTERTNRRAPDAGAASRWWSDGADPETDATDAASRWWGDGVTSRDRTPLVRTVHAPTPARHVARSGSLVRTVDEFDGDDARVTAAELHAIMRNVSRRSSKTGGGRAGHLRVYYNKVGKCGSRSMVSVIRDLAPRNSFVSVGSVYGSDLKPNEARRRRLQEVLRMLPAPLLYHRHVYYFPLARVALPPPLLINMVRHPLDRAVSSYYFRRFGDGKQSGVRGYFQNGTRDVSFDACVRLRNRECEGARGLWYVVPFFCGLSPMCRRPSRAALEQAKKVVSEKYLFVGVSEYFEQSLRALEVLLPEMFAGAVETWEKQKQGPSSTKTLNKKPLSASARLKALARMELELEFYHFVRDLFFRRLRRHGIPFVQKP